ncbi:hypothetical protein GCM10009745_41180 [Kribbella yunnanensis]|uniref:Condensation domain-containing protein n=2 Tax=Kribbella yunnanensis TaxID=190194 RepID=A0ABP4TR50_9ACTN
MWDYFQRMSPGVERYDVKFSHILRPAASISTVERVLEILVRRHESLRTVFEVGPDAVPAQRVLGAGVIVAEILESPTGSACEPATARTSEWPLEFAVRTTRGLVTRIDFAASHLAIDGWGAQRLLHDLDAELRYAEAGVPRPEVTAQQPVDRAAAEQTESFRSQNSSALEFWASQLRELPSRHVPKLPRPDEGGTRYRWGQLTSARLLESLSTIRSVVRCTASAPFLMAINSVTAQVTGADANGFRVIFHNRIDRAAATSVGCFFRETLIALDGRGDSRESLRRTSRGILQACRHAASDPRAVETMLRGAGRDAYTNNARLACFNFFDHREPGAELQRKQRLPGAEGPTGFEWLPGLDRDGQMMYWNVDIHHGGVVLRLLADSEHIPPQWIRSALYECEQTLGLVARELTSSDATISDPG